MKRFRAVLTFDCDSTEQADAFRGRIIAAAREEQAENLEIRVREEVQGAIGRPKSVGQNDQLPALMDYDEIFEPSPEAL